MAYELKTKVNDASVEKFILSVDNEKRKEDALRLLDIFAEVTGEEPKMWGKSIVGYGSYTYKYASGQSGDWMETGFSPRKASMSLYIMNYLENYPDILDKLGKHKTGKGCLYINKLEDVDINVLKELIRRSITDLRSGKGIGVS
jgi:hypothetical protein